MAMKTVTLIQINAGEKGDNMNIWLIKDSEKLPIDAGNQRLARMGLLAEKFSGEGHNVIWWTSAFSHFEKAFRDNRNHKKKVKGNYNIFLLKTFGYKKNVSIKRLAHNWKIASEFYALGKIEANKPDAVVVGLPTISFVVKAIKFGKKHNVPVIVDVRDLNPDVFADAFTGYKKKVVKIGIIPLQLMLKKAMKNATAIIGTTQPYLDYGLKYANRKQKNNDGVFYVAYPENKDKLNETSIQKWKEYELDEKTVICFFGQFGSMVDADTVIGAAKICDEEDYNIVFMLCGTGEKLDEYISKTKGLKNIFFPGWINKDDIRALGEISVAGLMAYKSSKNYELQMPSKFSEYLSFGLIPLVQPDGIMKSVIDKNKCGFSYKTSQDLADVAKYINENIHEINEMKKRARALYEKSFCAEKVYQDYVKHIVDIAEDYNNEV